MEIEVNKKALYSFLEKLVENRTPSNDNFNRMELMGDEPIKPVDMMATQLAQQKPDVSDPDYIPSNNADLAAAASVIASEVPSSQIDFYYRKLHKLLDIVLDRNYDAGFINESYEVEYKDDLILGGKDDDIDYDSPTTPDEWEQIEDILTPNEESLVQDVQELYYSLQGKLRSLKTMGMDELTIQKYRDELGFMFDVPDNNSDRTMQMIQIFNYAKQDLKNFINKVNDIAQEKNVRPAAVEMSIIGNLLKDSYLIPTTEMQQLSADDDEDISAIQYANQLFDAIIARSNLKRQNLKRLSHDEMEKLNADISETIAKLIDIPTIDVSSVKKLPAGQESPMPVSGDFIAQKLQSISSDLLGTITPEEMGIDIEQIDIIDDKVKTPKLKPTSLDDAKTFTDMASFLGFSSASGTRQWFLKHVNSKFSLLLHTMANPDDIGPGLLAYKDAYSQTLLQIIDLMTERNAMTQFAAQYPTPKPGTSEFYAINALMQDLGTLAIEADKVGNILDVKHADAKRLNKALRTHVADAIKGRHTEIMKAITTHILDKAAPGIIVSILQKKLPNENPEILKKLHEYISGKSNRPDFDAAEIDKTTQKFINLGIGKNEYLEIVQEYMEELDEALEIALLAPDRAVAIYGNKAAAMLKRMPDMSKLWQKVDKKSKLNKKAIFDIMEEAFLQYKDEYEQTKEHDESAIKESIAGNLINMLQEYL